MNQRVKLGSVAAIGVRPVGVPLHVINTSGMEVDDRRFKAASNPSRNDSLVDLYRGMGNQHVRSRGPPMLTTRPIKKT